MKQKIEAFLKSPSFGVIGASRNRDKFGNKVLRCYLQHQKTVYPVNPNEEEIENLKCIHQIKDLPSEVQSISIITPPLVTETVVQEAIKKGIKNIWMQPGAESKAAIQTCESQAINLIYGGPCILVILGFDG